MLSDKQKDRIGIFSLALILAAAGFMLFFYRDGSRRPVINEVAFSLEGGVDWIEIYNPTMNNISLEGLYVSDRMDNPTMFRVKTRVIVPGNGFALVYGRGAEDGRGNSAVANFRIAEGETVFLVASDGKTVLDSIEIPDVANGSAGMTVGRIPDGRTDVTAILKPTPGEPNRKNE